VAARFAPAGPGKPGFGHQEHADLHDIRAGRHIDSVILALGIEERANYLFDIPGVRDLECMRNRQSLLKSMA
jgi:hypothetical protein